MRPGLFFPVCLSLGTMATMAKGDKAEDHKNNSLLLYNHDYSFYAQKVVMALHEKKLPFQCQTINIMDGENYQPWYLDINPRGEVPVLKDGVKIIPDSSMIMFYLEDNFSNGDSPRLLPVSPEEKQRVTFFHELINKIPANVVTAGSCFHPEFTSGQKLPFYWPVRVAMKSEYGKTAEKLRKVAEENPKYKDILLQKAEDSERNFARVSNRESFVKLLDEVESVLSQVEEEIASHKDKDQWLVTEEFSIADISLSILLQRLSLIGLENHFWGNGKKPHVAAYFERVQSRPAFQEIVPSLMFHFKTLIGYKVLAATTTVLAAIIAGSVYCWVRKSD